MPRPPSVKKRIDQRKVDVVHDFKEYKVGLALQITLEEDNRISLHGLSPDHLPKVLRAIHAVS